MAYLFEDHYRYYCTQEVTKKCGLSLLTNSALVYEPKCWGMGVAGSQPMSTSVHNAHGAQTNFGDLTPYLTYDCTFLRACLEQKKISFIYLTLTLTSESVYGSQFFHGKLLQLLMS